MVVRKQFAKESLRSITHSLSRFWAIFAIVGLGAGFFAGLHSAAPDMRLTGDAYYDGANMMDLHLLSTLGFSQGDVEAIRATPNVLGVMPTHSVDVAVRVGGAEKLVRVHGLPPAETAGGESDLNRPVLAEGRMPQAPGECVVGRSKLLEGGLSVGDRFTIEDPDGDLLDSLARLSYTVVGVVDSAYYLTFSVGSTGMGNGQLNFYIYVDDSEFTQTYYTDLYATVSEARGTPGFGEEYNGLVAPVKNSLKQLAKARQPMQLALVRADAQETLDDGRREYDEKKADADKQLADAQKKLDDGNREIAENQIKLADAQRELADGQKKVDDNTKTLEDSKIELEEGVILWTDGNQKLERGQNDYEKAHSDYVTQRDEVNLKLRDAQKEINDGNRQLSSGQSQLAAQSGAYESAKVGDAIIGGILGRLPPGTPAIDTSTLTPQEKAVLEGLLPPGTPFPPYLPTDTLHNAQTQMKDGIRQYEEGASALSGAGSTLRSAQEELSLQRREAAAEFADAEIELADAKKELDDAQNTLLDKWDLLEDGRVKITDGEKKLADARVTLADAREKLLDGEQKLADGKQKLLDGQREYDEKSLEAKQKLADAQIKIDDGQAEIDKLKMPEWYVLDRTSNIGYVSFRDNNDRMDSLSTVFPILFFLVAALVALTTMTRMVEEERVLIGTYKALGYSTGKIASKYMFYAALSSVLGSIAGILLLNATLPLVCWNAYRIMYTAVPDLTLKFQWSYAIQACGVSALCTMAATLAACLSTLRESPATLMLPRAPKAGKRIFLERISFVWRRIPFTGKVTCRNLFRYKRRLIMTVVGIAGCTALLLTGFGIKDAVSSIISNQYERVYRYNVILEVKDEAVSPDLQTILDNQNNFSQWLLAAQKSADVTANGKTIDSTFLFVPQQPDRIKSLVNLRPRTTQEDIPFDENSVIITEKLSVFLNIGVGSSITLPDADGREVSFTVTGVTENYVYHYVYIHPALYEKKMGEALPYNQVVAVSPLSGDARAALFESLGEAKGVSTVSDISDISSGFEDMVSSLNIVILVIILCAGVLAFVVLYNLTNINVTERQREIATIKVLGFFDKEVSSYIYRETGILSVLGCVLGLGMGVVMNRFVIETVEVNMVMFGRDIFPLSFAFAAAITLFFSLVVNLVMYKKLQKIDMVESLKSVD